MVDQVGRGCDRIEHPRKYRDRRIRTALALRRADPAIESRTENVSSLFRCHIFKHVDNAVGIAHFIVVPCDQFIKTTVQRDPCCLIENAGIRCSDEIRGDHLLVCDGEDSSSVLPGRHSQGRV